MPCTPYNGSTHTRIRTRTRLLLFLSTILFPISIHTNPTAHTTIFAAAARQDLYKTLNIPKTATSKEITKAYRKLALKHHPDKVPESEREASEKKFKEIGYAHDVLTDEGKRERYDQYGEKGLEDGFHPGFGNMGMGGGGGGGFSSGGGSPFGASPGGFGSQGFSFGGGPQGAGNFGGDFGGDLGDILRQFMGGGGMGMGGMGGMPSGMGMGGMNFGNSGMNGMGGGFGSGSGSSPRSEPLKPQTKEFYCTLGELSDMSGTSKMLKVTMPHTDPMTGQQTKREKIYNIDVKPGWKEGTKIRYKATKDGIFPPMTFVLKEKKHKYISRRGDDLVYKCAVTERQAEKGAKLRIPLPDGELLELETKPDEIQENYVKRIHGKGMPIRSAEMNSGKRGDFVIEFRIRKQSQSEKKQI